MSLDWQDNRQACAVMQSYMLEGGKPPWSITWTQKTLEPLSRSTLDSKLLFTEINKVNQRKIKKNGCCHITHSFFIVHVPTFCLPVRFSHATACRAVSSTNSFPALSLPDLLYLPSTNSALHSPSHEHFQTPTYLHWCIQENPRTAF